jgi:hypothetical protein
MNFIAVGDCSGVMEKCSHSLSTTRLLSQNSHVKRQEVLDLYADVCCAIFLDIPAVSASRCSRVRDMCVGYS